MAARLTHQLGPGATVTDIATTRGTVGSSLTAVDLAGLTRVELGFALLLAAAAGGLVLALGLTERRRSAAITAALGAPTAATALALRSTRRQPLTRTLRELWTRSGPPAPTSVISTTDEAQRSAASRSSSAAVSAAGSGVLARSAWSTASTFPSTRVHAVMSRACSRPWS